MVLTGKSETCCVTSLEIYALDLVTKDTHRIPDPHKQASTVSVSGPFPLCLCAEIGNQGISCADKLLSMKKTHGFSGPHEGYAGCNPHESLCWIKSSPLRQLVLKYWNGWNCLKKKKKKALKSPGSYVRCASPQVNTAKEGHEKTLQRPLLRQSRKE